MPYTEWRRDSRASREKSSAFAGIISLCAASRAISVYTEKEGLMSMKTTHPLLSPGWHATSGVNNDFPA